VALGTRDGAKLPQALNPADWIVGHGIDGTYQYRGFILRPNE
jgi:hypothetical protein